MESEKRRDPAILRSLGVILLVLAVLVIGSVALAAGALPGCAGCHQRRSGFEKATASTPHAHAGTTCVQCHVQTDQALSRAKFGLYEALGMWVPLLDPAATDATLVRDGRCLSCHQRVLDQTVTAKGLRIAHESCARGRQCVDCHSAVGHGAATVWPRAASMNDCVECHGEMKAPLACETCHVGRLPSGPTSAKSEFALTHGANWKQTHGMGRMSSCAVCHAADACSGCHGPGVPHSATFINSHAKVAGQSGAACTTCHDKTFCLDCHRTEMPHPRAFASQHSALVKKDGSDSCLRCHTQVDCDTCHLSHVHPGGAIGKIPSPSRGGSK